jgi:hypothetical protein
MNRSLVFSILKCEYGWNGCFDDPSIVDRIEIIIENSCSEVCAAKVIAGLLYDEGGEKRFSPRIDGKPNTRSVVRDRAEQKGLLN